MTRFVRNPSKVSGEFTCVAYAVGVNLQWKERGDEINMSRVIELVSSFPTSVFTAVLAFCLIWWIIFLALSGGEGGNDGDTDFDVDADVDADIELGHGHAAGHMAGVKGGRQNAHRGRTGSRGPTSRFAKAIGFGQVPLSLSLTVLSFGAFAVSGLLQLAAEGNDATDNVAVGLVIMLIALGAGGLLHKWFARVTQPVFVTNTAPSRHAAIGATCRIRTTHVTASLGEAEVTSGSAIGQIVRVRTDSGDFARGDVAHLVGYDQSSGSFTIVELDPDLKELL
jgi:hypothetical protein